MRIPYQYPNTEEPFAEVALAVELDDFRESRKRKKLMSDTPLILKYRPASFSEVRGNPLAVKSLEEALHSSTRPHAFLLTGESGIGKTTIARIIAKEVGAAIVAFDAASKSGIDDTRELVEISKFRPITVEKNRIFIIDECHNFSDKAWEPFLALVEEPPSYIYLAFCTTEPDSVPKALKTRCYTVALKPLRTTEIEAYVQDVCDLEGWKVKDDVFCAICNAAFGSARLALSILQAGHALNSAEELSQVVATVEAQNEPVLQLCNYLVKGGRAWVQVSKYMERVTDLSSDIPKACRYLTNAMARSEEGQAKDIYRLLRAFTDTNYSFDKKVQFYTAIGKIMWGEVPF